MNKPAPCIICGHAKMIVNDDETQFAVYCDCGVGETGETKEEAAQNWNALHTAKPTVKGTGNRFACKERAAKEAEEVI